MENLTTTQFKEKIVDFEKDKIFKGHKPVVIDFYAPWCAPCKVLGKTLEEVSKQYDNVEFYKVNIDEEFQLAQYYNIKSIPQVLFLSEKDNIITIGNKSAAEIKNVIQKIL